MGGIVKLPKGFIKGFSKKFEFKVRRPGDAVPEPAAAFLFAAGMLVAGHKLRRSRK